MSEVDNAQSSDRSNALAESKSLLADWNESNQVFLKLAQEAEALLSAQAEEPKTPPGKSKAKPKR